MIPTGLLGENGEQLEGPGVATSPPHLVLSPMNYGNVWMQGVDMGFTQLIPEFNLIIDGNVSWYGTTEFYNELTKKNDPINAPKWKWNASIKWDSFLGGVALNYRHVDKFKWNDGIWAGTIGPYNIIDFHYNYKISRNLELSGPVPGNITVQYYVFSEKMGQTKIKSLHPDFTIIHGA